jgi:uncharacterized ParB-like nuclease family protein
MKLNGRKFGIEIEFYVPRRNYDAAPLSFIAQKLRGIGVEVYAEARYLQGFHNNRATASDRHKWALGTDSSLHESHLGQGLELATPPLKTDADVLKLKKVLKLLRDLGCTVGRTCGLHVHHEVDLGSFEPNKLVTYIVPKQPLLHGILKCDRQHNQYCQDWTAGEAMRKNERNADRRKFVNFSPFYQNEPHIEFRAHHGSLKFAEIMNWVLITQNVVEKSQRVDRDGMPEHLSDLLRQPHNYADLKRKLANFGHEYDDATLSRYLERAEKIDVAGTSYYFLSTHPVSQLARELKLERNAARYFLGKSAYKKEFGDV